MLVTTFLFGQSSRIQNTYFLVENCYHRFPELSSTQVRRLNQPSLQSRSEVELFEVWFGPLVERRLNRALGCKFARTDLSHTSFKVSPVCSLLAQREQVKLVIIELQSNSHFSEGQTMEVWFHD